MIIFNLGKIIIKQAGTPRPKSETINWYSFLGMQLNMYQRFQKFHTLDPIFGCVPHGDSQ